MSNPPINLTATQKDYAVFLPAISSFYSTYISKQRFEKFVPDERLPQGFDRGIEGMNFLNAEQGYFSYKYGLYSAGHACLDINKSITKEAMFHTRDKSDTIIVGDSGGFQIGKGVIKFDWHDFKGKSADKIRGDILNWLEYTADWSALLDVPPWASDSQHSAKTGLTSFSDCLNGTMYNNDYFIRNRQGKTKFLNVLQGYDWSTAETWYNAVKHYPTEGWAMGSITKTDMEIVLRRLIIMRDEKMLEGRDWMHFLGTGQLDWACYLTAIQRQIRKTVNENITLSLDCASPSIATARGLVYTNAQHTPKRWGVIMDRATDTKLLSGRYDMPFPFESEIGRRMSMGDICHYAPGMLNKIGKEGKTSWDSFSYALMMAHNTYCHIVAVQRANHLADIETARFKPDWRYWKKLRHSDTSDEYSEWVPRNILYFNRFVEELFQSENPMGMIDQAKGMLAGMRGSWTSGEYESDAFTNLFTQTSNVASVSDMDDPNDEKLLELEAEFNEQQSK